MTTTTKYFQGLLEFGQAKAQHDWVEKGIGVLQS